MLVKYDTSFFTNDQNVHIVLLFVYAPLVYSYLSWKKIGH